MTIQCRIHLTDHCAVSFKFKDREMKNPHDMREAFNRVMDEVPGMDCVKKLELEVI